MFTMKTQKKNSTDPKTFILVFGIFVTSDVSSMPMIDELFLRYKENNLKDNNDIEKPIDMKISMFANEQ